MNASVVTVDSMLGHTSVQQVTRDMRAACARGRALATVVGLLFVAACDAPYRAPAQSATVGSIRAVHADSGVWSSAQSQARWRSVVRAGHVREIHEAVAFAGAMEGTRVYEYDTARVLRRVTEQTWRAQSSHETSSGDTLAGATTPRRESVVEFQTDGPVLASRRFRDQPERMSRAEMRALYVRGYALLNRAIR